MRKLPNGDDIIRRLGDLAFGKSNDIVKLVMENELLGEQVGKLDLSLLSELKRNSNGTVEVKLVNRLDALELLAKLLGTEKDGQSDVECFYRAMESTAAKLEGQH
ncbi:MAG: hypothetical protein ACOX7K_09925 [Oscillospiraceae bacterium]